MQTSLKAIRLSLLLCLFLNGLKAFSQDIIPDPRVSRNGLYATSSDFKKNPSKPVTFKKGIIQLMLDSNRSESIHVYKLISQETDIDGITHYKWQQTIHNVPVEHAFYIQHVRDGVVLTQGGFWIKDSVKVAQSNAQMTKETAIGMAKQYVGAKRYKWEISDEEIRLR